MKLISSQKIFPRSVRRMMFAPNGAFILCGTFPDRTDAPILLIDPSTLETIKTLNAEGLTDVKCFAISDDSKFALSGHGQYGGGVKYWDLEKGTLIATLAKGLHFQRVAFEKTKAVISRGGSKLFRVKLDSEEEKTIEGSGGKLATFGTDKIWANVPDTGDWTDVLLRKGAKVLRKIVEKDHIDAIALSNRHLLTAGIAETRLHEIEGDGVRLLHAHAQGEAAFQAAFSGDGKTCAVIVRTEEVLVFDSETGAQKSRFKPGGNLESVAIDAHGERLFVGTRSGEIKSFAF